MISQISTHPRFKGRSVPTEDTPRAASITAGRASRISSYMKLQAILKEPDDIKLPNADRLIIARNLGRLLDQFRTEKGLISSWLVKAGISRKGDYTKHLPKIALYPNKVTPGQTGKGLMPKLGPYRKMAELAMRKLQPTAPDEDIKTILLDLIAGSALDPDKESQLQTLAPHEREILESMSDLYLMLNAIGHKIISDHDLGSYFRDIARWNLASTNGGGTFETMSHPLSLLAQDADWWTERLTLSPNVGLFDLCNEEIPFLEALWREEGSETSQPIKLFHHLTVVFGVAPIGRNGQSVPAIGQVHLCYGDIGHEYISYYPQDLASLSSYMGKNAPQTMWNCSGAA